MQYEQKLDAEKERCIEAALNCSDEDMKPFLDAVQPIAQAMRERLRGTNKEQEITEVSNKVYQFEVFQENSSAVLKQKVAAFYAANPSIQIVTITHVVYQGTHVLTVTYQIIPVP